MTVLAPSRADLRLAAIGCGVASAYDIVAALAALTGLAAIGYRIDLTFSDFLVFHAAARAAIEGKLAAIYDTNALTDLQNLLYAARLPYKLNFRPFLYPPLWLLGVLPFGFLPLGAAATAFLALTAALCAAALRLLKLGWWTILFILTAPAAFWVVIAGQNTFLSVALLYGGFALLERRPVAAGVLLGLLAYKPQVWLLVPLALLAARAWRPLIALAATVIVLCLVTLLLFGSGVWLAFFEAARQASSGGAAIEMYQRVHTHMTTLLAAAKILGVADGPAMAAQLCGSLLAVVAVAWVFARHAASPARTAVLVTATFLVSPYTLNYDLLLLMPAAALLFLHPPAEGFRSGERVVYLAVWLIPNFCMILNYEGLPVTPLIILLFGLVAWTRLAPQAKVELPGPAAAR
ncbi:MAG TPA: glycosyltransferase family 87 protein [Reyranella sp.]|nr:glycosyltransferase family 87 protein [Reyranella sp.]